MSQSTPSSAPTTEVVVDPATPGGSDAAPIWPGPAATAGRLPLAAAAVAGVIVAALVPLGRPGLGWTLAGLAMTAAVVLVVRRRGDDTSSGTGPPPHRGTWGRFAPAAWTAAALVLTAVGTVRAAGWVFVLCLLAAAAAVVMALTGARSVRGMALGSLLMPVAAVRGALWARRGMAAVRIRSTFRLGRTVAVTVLVLLVFGSLLASADAAFSRVLSYVLPPLDAPSVVRWSVLFIAGAGIVLAGVFLRSAPPTLDRAPDAAEAIDGRRRARSGEWAIPVGALVALFAGFVGVQLTVLFGGASYVLGPDGPTYAQYARSGFWQLLAVTALTLLVIGVVVRVADRDDPAQRRWLRGLLGPLALLSLVIVASALLRMHTYQQAYGFTRLRVLVSVAELWLGLVFLLVLVAGIRLRARWLPQAVVATGLVTILALAALNPDRFVAERNIDRWVAAGDVPTAAAPPSISRATGDTLDVFYLARLSPDAVPALVCLPPPHRDRALLRLRTRLAESPDDWRSANLGRATARELLADPHPDCPPRSARSG
jgi:hypothetical protein